ncbi:ATP-dependent DNA helicase Q-like 3 [Favolaschia claudopus]|uniref:DNA 3'-5' helicase n=1 Tax=Favolaschia claudopus TaxID=2862362 RepID=A0AAW0ALK0_9AGAR
MEGQILGEEILLHAATGAGKTGIAAGPHLLPSSRGKVTLMVSPLLSLHDEQVLTFRNEFGLKATAINSSNGGCTKEVLQILQKVVSGEWQIVMLSPEMLLSRQFVDGVLRKSDFGSRCLSVFIDEAHCISHWGASFRKKYASIGLIRAFLPRCVSIIAVTATLTPRVRDDLVSKLHFNRHTYMYRTIGNDRPNVSMVIRSMEHAANSYRDIDFVVPEDNQVPADIKLSFVYTDDIKDGGQLVDHLNARVHPRYRDRGLVRPYNAGMSREYRAHVMSLFRAGVIRVLVCTDAAGMGCDLPDIALVVQWKIPQTLSAWIQNVQAELHAAQVCRDWRRGRGGRGRGRGRGGRGGRGGDKQGRDYAILHGQKRGSFKGSDDAVPPRDEHTIADNMPREGIYMLIQATICRRVILGPILQNPIHSGRLLFSVYIAANRTILEVPPAQCCDICNPKLFDQVRPSRPVRASRQKGIRKGPPVDSVRDALFLWRRNILKSRYPARYFAANAILDDATCELLASVGPIDAIETLQQLLGSSWSRWGELGQELFVYMKGLDIPALPPPPSRQKKPASVLHSIPGSAASSTLPPPLPTTPRSPTVTNPRKRPSTSRDLSVGEGPPAATRVRLNHASPTPHAPHRLTHAGTSVPVAHTPIIPRPRPTPLFNGNGVHAALAAHQPPSFLTPSRPRPTVSPIPQTATVPSLSHQNFHPFPLPTTPLPSSAYNTPTNHMHTPVNLTQNYPTPPQYHSSPYHHTVHSPSPFYNPYTPYTPIPMPPNMPGAHLHNPYTRFYPTPPATMPPSMRASYSSQSFEHSHNLPNLEDPPPR